MRKLRYKERCDFPKVSSQHKVVLELKSVSSARFGFLFMTCENAGHDLYGFMFQHFILPHVLGELFHCYPFSPP